MGNEQIINLEVNLLEGNVEGLSLGIENGKRVVVFRFPGTDEIEARAYSDVSQSRRISEDDYELINLTPYQERYCAERLEANGI